MSRPIYLDYNATTPVDSAVLESMWPYFHDRFGNASSTHTFGSEAHQAVESARRQVADLLGVEPDEIVFTGGGSESDNLALKGVVFPRLAERPHIVATAVEHPAVLQSLRYLRNRFGVEYSLVPVNHLGTVSAETVRAAIRPTTVLISVMHANNEVGTVQPIAEIASVARTAGVLVHVDAAQTAGKIPVRVDDLGADLLTIAGHKLYGPKGVGALYVRRGTKIDPLVHGASQESGMRAGTENVPSLVGLGVACALARAALPAEIRRLATLRDLLETRLRERVPVLVNGDPSHRLPNTLNISFPQCWGQDVLDGAIDVAASTGSACHAGVPEPSSVLLAMGMPPDVALGAVRLSLGRFTSEGEVLQAADSLAAAWERLVKRNSRE